MENRILDSEGDPGTILAGMVYVMTNSADNNRIAAFNRAPDGTLSLMGFYGTRGLGTGPRKVSPATPNIGVDPLTSQGSIALSRDARFLFAVNAGSHSISSFTVADSGELTLVDVVPSGGLQPNSLAIYADLLYVSNVGSSENGYQSNIVGFRFGSGGKLAGIGSARKLSTINAQPSCVLFSPTGCQLVVSELTTKRLSVFHVEKDGTLSGPTVNNSSGVKPFGSCFLPSGLLLVTEAGPSAMSSYSVIPNGELRVISGSVPNGQMLACWVAPTRDGQYAYTSNTGSGTVTTYRINMNGTLNAIGSIYSTPEGMAMGAPIDCGVSWDGLNFYVLNGNQGSIGVFSIGRYGQLMLLQVMNNVGLPTLGSQGLAVF